MARWVGETRSQPATGGHGTSLARNEQTAVDHTRESCSDLRRPAYGPCDGLRQPPQRTRALNTCKAKPSSTHDALGFGYH